MQELVHNKFKTDIIKVMIVDDDNDWIYTLKTFLEKEEDIKVIEVANSKEEAIEKVKIHSDELDVILMDISFTENNIEGIYISAVISGLSKAKIIMLTSLDMKEVILKSFISGAVEFVNKVEFSDIPKVIRKTHLRVTPIEHLSREFSDMKIKMEEDVLTKTEKDVFNLVRQGYSRKHISEKMFCTFSNVKNHINKILKKLQAQSTKEAISELKVKAIDNEK